MDNKYNGEIVEAIQVDGIASGTKGVVQKMDLLGRFHIKWDNGTESVIRERGETYRFLGKKVTKNFIWKIKNYFLVLLKLFK